MHDIFFLDCFCARIFFWLLPNPPPLKYLMVRPLDDTIVVDIFIVITTIIRLLLSLCEI